VRYTTDQTAYYGVVPASPEDGPISLAGHRPIIDQAMTALGRLATTPATSLEGFLLSRLMRRQEALSSSGIEGTQSTLDAVLSIDAGTERDATARQVRRYAIILDELVPRATRIGQDIFTPGLFAEIHQGIMQDDKDYADVPGEIRKKVVWIGGAGKDIAYSTWNPPGPEHIRSCLEDTARYMRGNGPQVVSQGLILRIAIAHAHFEAVHPFLDGNGRVGRLLIPLMLAAEGHEPVYISPWIEANRSLYYEALKTAQQRLDPAPLAGAIATGIVETEKELVRTRRALNEITEIWKMGQSFRRNSSADRALSVLKFCPVLSVGTLTKILGVTPKAAGDGIEKLMEAGIVREITGQARNRIFVAPDILRIVSRPFGAKPAIHAEDEPDSEEPGWR
jgi:Fic family protein